MQEIRNSGAANFQKLALPCLYFAPNTAEAAANAVPTKTAK